MPNAFSESLLQKQYAFFLGLVALFLLGVTAVEMIRADVSVENVPKRLHELEKPDYWVVSVYANHMSIH